MTQPVETRCYNCGAVVFTTTAECGRCGHWLVRVVDITENDGDYFCRSYTVEREGKTYRLEKWSTPSADGVEVYDENGEAVYDNDNLPDDVMEQVEAVELVYEARIAAEVQPIIDRIKKEVFL